MKRNIDKEIISSGIAIRRGLEEYNKRFSWRTRAVVFCASKYLGCSSCRRLKLCRRLYMNEYIRKGILKGGKCYDFENIWERVL
jgi:hypothetical protein